VALIRPLCRDIGELTIHLETPLSGIAVDAVRAEALVRCVQETITNTLKHSAARNLWITLAAPAEGITVRTRDDGRGTHHVKPGAGLTGMRERFAQFGGDVSITTNTGAGFAMSAFLPAANTST
jgi:signal transduction histidine kinase